MLIGLERIDYALARDVVGLDCDPREETGAPRLNVIQRIIVESLNLVIRIPDK